MKQKINTLLASLALLLCSITMSAQTFDVDGITYTVYNEDEVYVSDCSQYEGDLIIPESVAYSGNDYKVTSIGKYAFSGCSGLTSVTIPNSITSIGESAFYGCTGLTSVTIPNSVTSIGGYAFQYCFGLTSITIPNSVTSIGGGAFSNCSGLTSVHISDIAAWCNIVFGEYAYSNPLERAQYLYVNGEEIKDLIIPNNVTRIGNYAFKGFSGLTSVTIPNSVTRIGEYAFRGCLNLKYVINFSNLHFTKGGQDYGYIADNASRVINAPNGSIEGDYVFAVIEDINTLCGYLKNDTELTLPANYKGQNYQIGSDAFIGYSSLTSVTIPNSVTSIGNAAFSGCSALASVTIPESVTSIGDFAFYGCSGFTSVTIPNNVTSVGDYAFYGCSGLTSVTIGNSVTTIESNAFYGCHKLKTVVNFSQLYFEKGSWSHGGIASIATHVINACNGFFDGDYVLGLIDGTNTLCGYIGDETDLTLPASYKGENYVIGSNVFSGCSALTSVTIPNSITSIGENAFYDCSGLTSVTIPNSVTSIGYDAFYKCTNLKHVINFSNLHFTKGGRDYGYIAHYATHVINAPNGSIEGDYVFGIIGGINALCGYLGNDTELTLPSNYKGQNYQIGSSAFEGYSSLTSVTIPNSVTSIGEKAFSSCSGLTSITIPNSVTSIGIFAFSSCSGLTSITIPNSVTSIGEGAFYGCSALTSVHISDIAAWCNMDFGEYSYYSNPLYYAHHLYVNGEEIKELVIPNGVTSIGDYAFDGCSGLTSITIPNSVTSIGGSAFQGCSGLTSVIIPNSVTSIGGSAFFGCSGLTSVTIGNSVTSIGENAFYGCSDLTSVTIPNSVTSIGSDAFYNCSNLKHVINFSNLHFTKGRWDNGYIAYYATHVINAPNGSIEGDYVFAVIEDINTLCGYLGNDTELTLPANYKGQNYQIGSDAFDGCTGLTSVTIPNSVTSIGDYAFSSCSGLTSVTIGNSVTNIGENAFDSCSGLTSVIIPNSVTSIGNDAFCNCSGLTLVTIGNSVTSIGYDAFYKCTNLKYVVNLSNLPFTKGDNGYGRIALYADKLINVPDGTIEDNFVFGIIRGINTLCAYIGNDAELILPANYKGQNYQIASDAFKGYSSLTSVTIPNSVTSIGGSAFYGCSGLTSVTIPNSVTSIGFNAFYNCTNLKYVVNLSNLPFKKGDNGYGCIALYADKLINVPDGTIEDNFVFCIIEDINTLCAYIGNDAELTLPANYKGQNYQIGSGAFSGCFGLASVTIPNSVTSIGGSAFQGCSGLTSVIIPNSVTSIGGRAFSGCSGLTSVTIGNSVTSIGEYAFYGCSGLTSVTIGNSVTSIGDYAFLDCSGLTSVTIPNSVMSIGRSAFSGCSSLPVENGIRYADSYLVDVTDKNLSTYIIQDGTRFIGSFAFSGCSALTSITIPNSVTSIGDDAFKGCQRLKTVVNFSNLNLVKGSTDFGYVAYYATKVINAPNASFEGNYVFSVIDGTNTLCLYLGDETELTLPENFKGENYVIGASAFLGYSGLTSVTIPNSVTSIGDAAFYGCSGLTSVTLPNSVTSIGNQAFYGCSGLTSVTIPNSVTSIGYNAFYGCSGLTSVHISDIAAWCNIEFDHWSSNPVYYSHSLYLNGGEVKELVIPNSVTRIGDFAFSGCSGLTSVAIPNSVTGIGVTAFAVCTGLTSVTIPNSVTSIQDYVFQGCSGLTSVTIPNSIRSIGSGAFAGCSGLRSVTIPSSVERIWDEAFYECSNLERVVNFSNLRFIEGSSDYGYIAYYADNVINAPNATIEGDYAFHTIEGKNILCAFLGDDTELILPENYKEENYVIGASAFSGCVSLTSVTIPNSVTSIGKYAFSGCKMIAKITIGNGITSISEYAFENCESLEEVYCLAENVPTTPTNAFRGSYIELATLYVPKVALKRYKVNAPWSGFGEIAEFTQTYTITYILDGVEFKKESWKAGAKIETPQAPEKEGHTFNGWEDVPETMPAMDIVLYGSYTVNIYKVYYYVGKELVHTDEVAYGESIPAYEYTPTNGDKFMGWDGKKYDTMPAHDVTYTANIVSSILYIKGDKSDYTIYDLNGRRIENINNLKNGVYIVNGKMTFVKVN